MSSCCWCTWSKICFFRQNSILRAKSNASTNVEIPFSFSNNGWHRGQEKASRAVAVDALTGVALSRNWMTPEDIWKFRTLRPLRGRWGRSITFGENFTEQWEQNLCFNDEAIWTINWVKYYSTGVKKIKLCFKASRQKLISFRAIALISWANYIELTRVRSTTQRCRSKRTINKLIIELLQMV